MWTCTVTILKDKRHIFEGSTSEQAFAKAVGFIMEEFHDAPFWAEFLVQRKVILSETPNYDWVK